jgi:hypothetical protein
LKIVELAFASRRQNIAVVRAVAMLMNPVFGLGVKCEDIGKPIPGEMDKAGGIGYVYCIQAIFFTSNASKPDTAISCSVAFPPVLDASAKGSTNSFPGHRVLFTISSGRTFSRSPIVHPRTSDAKPGE